MLLVCSDVPAVIDSFHIVLNEKKANVCAGGSLYSEVVTPVKQASVDTRPPSKPSKSRENATQMLPETNLKVCMDKG